MIHRPPFANVPLSAGLSWAGGGGFVYEEKMDGVFHAREFAGCLVLGELMKNGRFYAFDCLRVDGQDVRREPLRFRLAALDSLPLLRPATGCGGEFLEAVLARDGEGVVAKHLDSPYGSPWFKCKRVVTHDCIVTAKDLARGTIRLALDGADAGWTPVYGRFDGISIGDWVEVACHSRHVSGKLREPRFLRRRPDLADRGVFIR